MSKDKVHLLSPLFLRYQTDFEKNPKSRVFAPLAEMYRKIGMTDKAMEILAQGIKYHQDYLMGYLGLAFCYYDIKQFKLAYDTINPFVSGNRDNIRLQKLYIDCCLALDYSQEALDTCKYLLFINPKDKEVAETISRLESELEESYRHEHRPIFIPTESFLAPDEIDQKNIQRKPSVDFDDWQAVDLVKEESDKAQEHDKYDQWNVQKLDEPIKIVEKISLENEKEKEAKEVLQTTEPIEEDFSFTVDLESEKRDVFPKSMSMDQVDELKRDESENELESKRQEKMAKELPMITHTLVDLYCGQGHFEKAIEVLDKILELNPKEERTIKKRDEILEMLKSTSHSGVIKEVESEEEGRKSLMDVFDQSVNSLDFDSMENEEIEEELPTSEIDETSKLSHLLRENLMVLKEHSEIKSKDPAEHDKKQLLAKHNKEVEDRLNKFLTKIRKRAVDYQESF